MFVSDQINSTVNLVHFSCTIFYHCVFSNQVLSKSSSFSYTTFYHCACFKPGPQYTSAYSHLTIFKLIFVIMFLSDQIRSKPKMISAHPQNTSVESGGTASFQCRVKSNVQPHIKVWGFLAKLLLFLQMYTI